MKDILLNPCSRNRQKLRLSAKKNSLDFEEECGRGRLVEGGKVPLQTNKGLVREEAEDKPKQPE